MHAIFDVIFVALAFETFVALVLTSCRFIAFFAIWERDICCNSLKIAAKLHQVSSMLKTTVISRRQIAQKSLLVYTCDFHRELKRGKNCTKIACVNQF